MKKPLLSILQYLFFLLIGLGLLWLVFHKIDLADVGEQLKSINYFWILLLLIAGFFSHLFRALRWNLMINSMGYKTSNLRTFYAVMIGYLANTAIPRLGEVTRCGILSKTEKIPMNALIGSVISERVFDMIFLLLLTISVIIFQLKLVGGFVRRFFLEPFTNKAPGDNILIFIIIGIGVLLILMAFVAYYFLRPRIRHLGFYQKAKGLFRGFMDGILSILKLKQKGYFILLTLSIWSMYFMMTYLCFFSMEATSKLSPLDGLTVMTIGSFGFVAPVPGGIGAFHFIVKAILFELYKLSPAAAASYATIVHLSQTLLILVLGGLSYLAIVMFLRKKANVKY
ncbi:MAG: lysylphosphatidylglycerol synthase transmembrane domain-containing protein [Bacteroidota bacterium]